MIARPRVLAALILAAVVAVPACSDPYDGLTDAEAAYVIPGSSEWGEGDGCGGGASCSPFITPEEIEGYGWVQIESIGLPSGDENQSVEVKVGAAFPPSLSSLTTLRADPRSAESADGVLSDGYELWVAVNQERWMSHLVAFDDQGRFAGVGEAMGRYFTVPVAGFAAEADAPSGRDFLIGLFDAP